MISVMRQLLYLSNTHRDVSDDLLADILAVSRRNNKPAGITGILLYLEGGFLQVLEGEDRAVAEVYKRICADKRHWNASVLLDRNARAPLGTGAWGSKNRPQSAKACSLTRDAIDGKLKPGAPAEIMALLKTFYRINAGVHA